MNDIGASTPRAASPAPFRLGTLIIDPATGRVTGAAGTEQLDPKVTSVLVLLAEHAGVVVTREELLERVWPGVTVTDDAVSRCIYQLRRQLSRASGDASTRALIETLRKRGYRLTGRVVPFEPSVASSSLEGAPPQRSSTLWLRAAALAAAVIVPLVLGVRAPGGGGPSATDVAVDEMAPTGAGVREFELATPPRETRRISPDAHKRVLQAEFLYNRRGPGDIDRAEEHYRAALEIDPHVARAWTGLAAIHQLRYVATTGPAAESALSQMGEAAQRAIAIDPDSPAAHLRAAGYFWKAGKRERALEHWRRAEELNPDDPLLLGMAAGRAAREGRIAEAVALQRRAVERDPLSAAGRYNLAHFLMGAGRYAEARIEYGLAWELSPDLAKEYEIAVIAAAEGRSPEALDLAHRLPAGEQRDHILALAGAAEGLAAEALAALGRLRASADWRIRFMAAEALAMHEEHDAAFAELDASYLLALREDPRVILDMQHETHLSPFLRPLAADPRWNAWIARLTERPSASLASASVADDSL